MAEEEEEMQHEQIPSSETRQTWGDLMLVEGRELSPRHRKLAELAAQGISNKEIAKQLDYTDSRISILLSNTKIRNEVERIRERIYEETIGKRLRAMADPALNEIQRCLNDNTNRYKENLKVETAKWLIEKLDGKAVQKHDIGDNLLAVVMDKLDALKSTGKKVDDLLDVTPQITHRDMQVEGEMPQEVAKTEIDALHQWVLDFSSPSK
jgi:DNA-binding CsgD family transcriptional regulator